MTWLSVTPRFSVMLPYLVRPGSLRTWLGSLPSRYSIASVVVSPIATSLKAASATPSISTRNLKFLKGSSRAMMRLLCSASALGLGGVLEDAEDDELGRPHRGDADLADQPAVEDVVGRRLPDPPLVVGAGVKAEHVAARRHQPRHPALQVGGHHPGEIIAPEAGIPFVAGADVRGIALVRFAVEHGEAEPAILAMGDERAADRLVGHARRRHEGDLAIGVELERREARPLIELVGVALEVDDVDRRAAGRTGGRGGSR